MGSTMGRSGLMDLFFAFLMDLFFVLVLTTFADGNVVSAFPDGPNGNAVLQRRR